MLSTLPYKVHVQVLLLDSFLGMYFVTRFKGSSGALTVFVRRVRIFFLYGALYESVRVQTGQP